VRNKTGKVTCPTLLSQNCRNCGKNGHTVKYCKVATYSPTKQTEKKEPTNLYAIIEEESPVLFSTLPQLAPPPKKTSYLDILAREAPTNFINLKDLKKTNINLVPEKVKHSWASEVSSEFSDDISIDSQNTQEEKYPIARPTPILRRQLSFA
jgi:hypothetical protein